MCIANSDIQMSNLDTDKDISKNWKFANILEEITKLKWKWAGHVACMKDNR